MIRARWPWNEVHRRAQEALAGAGDHGDVLEVGVEAIRAAVMEAVDVRELLVKR